MNTTTNSDKKKAGILLTCYVIRRIRKTNDAGMWRGKEEEERATNEKIDG